MLVLGTRAAAETWVAAGRVGGAGIEMATVVLKPNSVLLGGIKA